MINIGFDEAQAVCKQGDYCTVKATALADPLFHARVQEYKRQLSRSMRAISGQDIGRLPKARGYYVTRKYDGEFTLLAFDGERVVSVNPGGTVRTGLPAYKEAEKLLKKAKVKSCLLATEIYLTGDTTTINRVSGVVSILRNPKSEAQLDKLGVAVLDIIEFDDKPVKEVARVFELLKKWFGKDKLIHAVDNRVANSVDAIMEAFTEWVIVEGSEGVVVRHDQIDSYKIKVRHNLDAAIIGYSEGTDERKGMLHDLLVAVMRDDGTFHELARVGGGFTDDDRKSIAADLKKRIVPSDYVAVNNDYVAYEMVKPGPVIEMSCLDLIAESGKGGPVNRMVLDWNGKSYSALSRMPLVSVISPQYVRLRDDKEAVVEDVNIRQISDLANIADIKKPAHEVEAEASKILERTVYTKTMKGNKMVRKLLLWKTNKGDMEEFPDFVVYLTDFSPNRQNPLERDIKVAHTEAAARKLFKKLADKNFIGGWEKAD